MDHPSEIEIQERKAYLTKLQEFIDESKTKLNCLLNELGWNLEDTIKQRKRSAVQDIQSDVVTAKHSMHLGSQELKCLVGEDVASKLDCFAADEMIKNLSTEQRLAVYEHCVNKTGHLSEPEISIAIQPTDGNSKRTMTFAEIVSQKRNLKRRTTRYRTGASKSYVSELRNLIELQMSALSQYADCNKADKFSQAEAKNVMTPVPQEDTWNSNNVVRSTHRPSSSSTYHRRQNYDRDRDRDHQFRKYDKYKSTKYQH